MDKHRKDAQNPYSLEKYKSNSELSLHTVTPTIKQEQKSYVCWKGRGEIGTLCTARGNANGATTMENGLEFPHNF